MYLKKGENDNLYSKTKMCNYCEELYPTEELTKKLTLKMIIQMDKHLSHRANQILERNPEFKGTESDFNWVNRAENRFLDMQNLYETHPVCKTCYKLYEWMTE